MAPTKFEPIKLVSPKRGLTMILTPDTKRYGPEGQVLETKRGKVAKFRDGEYVVMSADEWALIQEHSAFTGGLEPRIVFTLDQSSQMPPSENGVRVVTGAVSSTSGARASEPIPGYDQMQYAQLRKAVQDGKINDLAAAITYEQSFRRRRGVIELFAAGIVAKALPSAAAMEKADEVARAEALAAEEQVDQANPGDLPEMDDDTAATAAALAAREAIDEAIDTEHSEPVPPGEVL